MTALAPNLAEVPAPRRFPLLARLLRHRLFLVGALICLAVLLCAALAGVLAGADPNQMQITRRLKPPSALEWFGSDGFGRDLFSRVLYGSRVSLLVGLSVAVITGVLGTVIGALAGFFRRLDGPLMRVMDALMAFPAVLLAIAITAAMGPSIGNVIFALGVTYTPRTARVARAAVLVAGGSEYVQAARAYGAGNLRLLCAHVLPNCVAPLIVQVTFVFGYAVLAEAVLSFLGMGTPPPTASWGNIVADGRTLLRVAPWICLFPGMAIALFVFGLNLLGDGLRDVLDPRMRVERD
jgi:peptide/nickel transport system permease protein